MAAGHPLAFGSEPIGGTAPINPERCQLCGEPSQSGKNHVQVKGAAICQECSRACASGLSGAPADRQFRYACGDGVALRRHPTGPAGRATRANSPATCVPISRGAIDKIFTCRRMQFFGVHEKRRYETVT